MKIRVIPGAKKFEIVRRGGALVVKVRAHPEKGKANGEVEKELSRLTGLRVRVCKGLKSREKEIIAEGSSEEELESRLDAGVAEPGQKSTNRL